MIATHTPVNKLILWVHVKSRLFRVQFYLVGRPYLLYSLLLFADGIRKMRNLLLFHDILVCAKQKLSRNHVKLEYKWYLPLAELQFHPYFGAESKG